MQGVRSVKKVSYKHELLSYAQARALYFKTESLTSNKGGCCRDFIANRWRLGNYFERALPKSSSERISWIQMYWPEISEQSILFWINFSRECPHYVFKVVSTDELKRVFIEKAIVVSHLHPAVTENAQDIPNQKDSAADTQIPQGVFKVNYLVKKVIRQLLTGAYFHHAKKLSIQKKM